MTRRIPRPVALGAGGLLLFLVGLGIGGSGDGADADQAQRFASMPAPTVTRTMPAAPAPTVTVTSTPPPAPTVTVSSKPVVRTVTKTVEAAPQAAADTSRGSGGTGANHDDDTAVSGASYGDCSEARAAGVTPLHRGDPGYASHLDRDNDGVACE